MWLAFAHMCAYPLLDRSSQFEELQATGLYLSVMVADHVCSDGRFGSKGLETVGGSETNK